MKTTKRIQKRINQSPSFDPWRRIPTGVDLSKRKILWYVVNGKILRNRLQITPSPWSLTKCKGRSWLKPNGISFWQLSRKEQNVFARRFTIETLKKLVSGPTVWWSRTVCKVRCCMNSEVTNGLTHLRLPIWYRAIQCWTLSWQNSRNFSLTPAQKQGWPRMAAQVALKREFARVSGKTSIKLPLVPWTENRKNPSYKMFSKHFPTVACSNTSSSVRKYGNNKSHLTNGLSAMNGPTSTDTESHCHFRRDQHATQQIYTSSAASQW